MGASSSVRSWIRDEELAPMGRSYVSRVQPEYLLLIGYRRSRPNARRLTFGPGAA